MMNINHISMAQGGHHTTEMRIKRMRREKLAALAFRL